LMFYDTEKSSKLPNMTFILEARWIDGVVLVADRKITKMA
jgi:hypothetical protein